ncbi:hypothetical protein POPTR_013G028950v4 [Populus trichocarpa]|uniref:Uncharacterized protein n=1 Tax=Populus trichocarpa TaxID=3694 RepID=A0ACC0S162_POPTR|nr:hypothetical protein POPTR_013G028950v4 [Populus trichocarpa]
MLRKYSRNASTWLLEAQKAFILKLRRSGWILYYYFAIMQQLDEQRNGWTSQREKQTFTLNTVFILNRHLEARSRFV